MTRTPATSSAGRLGHTAAACVWLATLAACGQTDEVAPSGRAAAIRATNMEGLDVTEQEMRGVALRALEAWGRGEKSGDYSAYRAMLHDGFDRFVHPMKGRFQGAEARRQMEAVMTERAAKPNALTFSDPTVLLNEGSAVVLFGSRGRAGNIADYDGQNAIAFDFREGRVAGFREYFGHSDPSWTR